MMIVKIVRFFSTDGSGALSDEEELKNRLAGEFHSLRLGRNLAFGNFV